MGLRSETMGREVGGSPLLAGFFRARSAFVWVLGLGTVLITGYYLASPWARGYLHALFPEMVGFYVLQSLTILYVHEVLKAKKSIRHFSFARLGGVTLFRILTAFFFFLLALFGRAWRAVSHLL